jgi:hypothetical protein
MVLIQLFNAFNSRSMEHSAFYRAFSNPWLVGAAAGWCCRSWWSSAAPAGGLRDHAAGFGAVGHLCGDGLDHLWVEEIQLVAWLVRR